MATELDKWSDALPTRQVITEFLEWLAEQKLEIAAWRQHGTAMMPVIEDRERMLDRFTGIDANQLERERRALLDRKPQPQRGKA